DADTFESAVEKIYQKQKKTIQLKGFRKGKAPRKLIEKEYGEGVFYEDAINSLLPAEIDSAVAETKLDLVDRPSVELLSIDKENGVELKAVCVTKPEITISDYKGIKAPKKVKEITEEDIENQIYNIRKKNARLVSVDDRPAQMGDEVILDFEGFFGDEAFEGGKGENHPLRLGSGQFIPGFEEQVAGHSIDEDFNVNVTFPETYQMEEYAGKEAVFKCKIKSISFEELPEINDDLVKDATEFNTVDEYKADIREKLEEAAKNQAEAGFENAIMNAVIAKVDSPIPNCMYERRIDSLVNAFDQQLHQNNMKLDLYLQYTGMDMDSLRDTYRERAVSEVKLRLALEKIAELENIEITDEEVDASLSEMAEANKMTLDMIKRFIPADEYKEDMKVQKAIELLKDSAVIDNSEDTDNTESEESAENKDAE
ncbi:MAG: trigger factor, partial [Oscillospiraceae bacterium]|nr:trigger factor [Oscillospiraceae bacterium]